MAKAKKKKRSGKLSQKEKWMTGCLVILGIIFIAIILAVIYSLTVE